MANENIIKKLTAIKSAAMNLGVMGMNPNAVMEHMAQILGIYNTASALIDELTKETKESGENGR